MITIKKTTNDKLIKAVVTDPILWDLEQGQSNKSLDEWEPEKDYHYVCIQENEQVLGLISTRELTKICLEIHSYVLPTYWGCNKTGEIFMAFKQYALKSGYRKLLTMIPEVCTHVLAFVERQNFKICGCITNGIIYTGQLMTLYLYEYDLMRSTE